MAVVLCSVQLIAETSVSLYATSLFLLSTDVGSGFPASRVLSTQRAQHSQLRSQSSYIASSSRLRVDDIVLHAPSGYYGPDYASCTAAVMQCIFQHDNTMHP